MSPALNLTLARIVEQRRSLTAPSCQSLGRASAKIAGRGAQICEPLLRLFGHLPPADLPPCPVRLAVAQLHAHMKERASRHSRRVHAGDPWARGAPHVQRLAKEAPYRRLCRPFARGTGRNLRAPSRDAGRSARSSRARSERPRPLRPSPEHDRRARRTRPSAPPSSPNPGRLRSSRPGAAPSRSRFQPPR